MPEFLCQGRYMSMYIYIYTQYIHFSTFHYYSECIHSLYHAVMLDICKFRCDIHIFGFQTGLLYACRDALSDSFKVSKQRNFKRKGRRKESINRIEYKPKVDF